MSYNEEVWTLFQKIIDMNFKDIDDEDKYNNETWLRYRLTMNNVDYTFDIFMRSEDSTIYSIDLAKVDNINNDEHVKSNIGNKQLLPIEVNSQLNERNLIKIKEAIELFIFASS